MKNKECQIMSVDRISEKLTTDEVMSQLIKKLRITYKRRRNYFKSLFSELSSNKKKASSFSSERNSAKSLVSGDLVRVRPKEEIQSTLNRWGQLKGCGFMEEMWPYCETTQRVFKCVNQFLDERDYLVKKCTGIVILDGIICEGTKDFGVCDRACFYFWREEWLEKYDSE